MPWFLKQNQKWLHFVIDDLCFQLYLNYTIIFRDGIWESKRCKQGVWFEKLFFLNMMFCRPPQPSADVQFPCMCEYTRQKEKLWKSGINIGFCLPETLW